MRNSWLARMIFGALLLTALPCGADDEEKPWEVKAWDWGYRHELLYVHLGEKSVTLVVQNPKRRRALAYDRKNGAQLYDTGLSVKVPTTTGLFGPLGSALILGERILETRSGGLISKPPVDKLSQAVVHGGKLFSIEPPSKLQCIDAKGQRVWLQDLSGFKVSANEKPFPVRSGIAVKLDDGLVLFSAAGKPLWKFQLDEKLLAGISDFRVEALSLKKKDIALLSYVEKSGGNSHLAFIEKGKVKKRVRVKGLYPGLQRTAVGLYPCIIERGRTELVLFDKVDGEGVIRGSIVVDLGKRKVVRTVKLDQEKALTLANGIAVEPKQYTDLGSGRVIKDLKDKLGHSYVYTRERLVFIKPKDSVLVYDIASKKLKKIMLPETVLDQMERMPFVLDAKGRVQSPELVGLSNRTPSGGACAVGFLDLEKGKVVVLKTYEKAKVLKPQKQVMDTRGYAVVHVLEDAEGKPSLRLVYGNRP